MMWPDNDDDGWTNDEETTDCVATGGTATDPLDDADSPSDYDLDGLCDELDDDDDDDGIADADDAFPNDATEDTDTDGDTIGDNADTDDDGDGWGDIDEINCDCDPLDPLSVPTDNDGDAVCDLDDPDDDNDGVPDDQDAFPYDANENTDTDGDAIGDNDDDDDDGDGWGDIDEINCDSDPLDPLSAPTDNDGDGTCDSMDTDVVDDGGTYVSFPEGQTLITESDGHQECVSEPSLLEDKSNSGVPGFGMIATVCILVTGAVIIDRRSH